MTPLYPLNPDYPQESRFLANLDLSQNFYAAMMLTFGKKSGISPELAEKSQALRRWLVKHRPDLDKEAWIHSWQAKSTKEEQRRVAVLLKF